jgi:hypothetical protein
MSEQEFLDAVLRRLRAVLGDDRADRDSLRVSVRRMYRAGFDLHDAVDYVMLTEEVSPELDEAAALRRMANIGAKYPRWI